MVSLAAGEVLYNPGGDVNTVYFPCEGSAICFVVAIEDGHEVDVPLIGREGAAGGIVSHGRLPAFSRIEVRLGRLPVSRIQAAKEKSSTFSNVFARYSDCLLAQILQSSACNAAHSIEQRAAKCILAATARTGGQTIPFGHAQPAAMLGVGRSYATRIIRDFSAKRILRTGRMELEVLDPSALRSKSCNCDEAVKSHFTDVLRGVYPP
ncbi:MAG: Crp/Fnr family transcriptional regulator [Bradyrhizobium sp.]|uniref:Crp/Fnr family transcriptional regulator n=1 Tax=Bradyrhizobium sp. TaxID=376 RepID=UPI001D9F0400|nr:helix-turn-helix domain-containing protein [Bradyrhizobium sp.]MBV9563655.1 Crp/Fnr family transcriptional regulator [Bradyrhizobium sp.]